MNVPPVAEAFTLEPDDSLVMPGAELRAAKHNAAFDRVMAAAADLFDDPAPFNSAFLTAMNERGSAAIAELCRRLRTEPDAIGEIKPRRRLGRAPNQEALTQKLRAEIIAARNSLNADLAEWAMDSKSTDTAMTIASDLDVVTSAGNASVPITRQSTKDSIGLGGSAEPRDDIFKLIDAVNRETGSWTDDVKARVESKLRDESVRAAFEETIQSLKTSTEMFEDIPDDLSEVLENG